jgi:branched-chain amino acid transport system permease protein
MASDSAAKPGFVERIYGARRPHVIRETLRDVIASLRADWFGAAVVAGAAGVALLLFAGDSRTVGQAAQAAYLLVALYGLRLLTVDTAQPSLGHAGFIAAGAYLTAFLRLRGGVNGLLAALLCAAAVGVVGLVIGFGTSRLRPSFVALATWAFGWLVTVAIGAAPQISGGVAGITFGAPLALNIDVLGLRLRFDEAAHLVLAASLVVVVGLLLRSAQRSVIGLAWSALRDGPSLARALGYDVAVLRRAAFVASAASAGLAGSLVVQLLGVVDPSRFTPLVSLELFAAVLIGARAGILGPVLGLAVVTWVPAGVVGAGSAAGLSLDRAGGLLAALLTVVALFLTQRTGTVGDLRRRPRQEPDQVRDPAAAAPPQAVPHPGGGGTQRTPAALADEDVVLRVRDARRAYGGVQALDGISFEVCAGEVRGLIGPNGSGKTTLLRCVAGALSMDAGSVELDGSDVSALGEVDRVHAGIVRTFQRTVVLPHLTPGQHAEIGLRWRCRHASWWKAILKTPAYRAESRSRANAAKTVLAMFGLDGVAGSRPLALSAGRQRLLQVAAAAATGPSVLLLDEPSDHRAGRRRPGDRDRGAQRRLPASHRGPDHGAGPGARADHRLSRAGRPAPAGAARLPRRLAGR